ncbi:MAG TPA: rhodanese-like domain-containing protein [Candidatus Eisenbacteria bacterium]|jgi:rhodanese-related sulfurtransferase
MSGSFQSLVAALALSVAAAGCGGSPGDNVVSQAAHVGVATMQRAMIGHLQGGEVRGYLSAHRDALVLDVREASEWSDELGSIDGARRIPLSELQGRLTELDSYKDRPVVVVDRSGGSSARACEMLAAAGFQQVMNLEGGMVAWRQAAE